MALTAAQLQEQIDALNLAIGSGTRSVTLGGQTVTYGTTDALIKARNDLLSQVNALNAQASGHRRPKQSYLVQNGRGYHTGSRF